MIDKGFDRPISTRSSEPDRGTTTAIHDGPLFEEKLANPDDAANKSLQIMYPLQARSNTLHHAGFPCPDDEYLHCTSDTTEASKWLLQGYRNRLIRSPAQCWAFAKRIFYLLPLGLRVQEKLCRLADEAMRRAGASKLEMPTLSSAHLWRKTGRWITTGDELFRMKDRRHSEFCLAPTNEEDITSLVAGTIQSWRALPVKVYQITRKFRDEKRPRAGLLRGREFLMKDMYSFDMDETTAMQTYNLVREAYDWFFNSIGLPFVTADAEGGNIGGSLCHEYHYLSEAGEDVLYRCTSCSYSKNEEVHIEEDDPKTCPQCQMDTLTTSTAIEMGHTFYLGTKYSSVFNAKYMPKDDPSKLLAAHMGCYGLGLSRMIGAIAEVSHDNEGIIWPEAVAPWKCVIIEGSVGKGESIYDDVGSVIGTDNVLLDDRPNVSAGWKMNDARKIGYPHIIVLGRQWEETGLIEVVRRKSGETLQVERPALLDPNFWKTK